MSGERHMTMQEALEADGEKLRQLTGEDHGPWDSSGKGNEMTDVPDDVRRRLQAHDLSAAETRSLLALAYRQIDGDSPFTSHDAKTILALLERVDARAALAPKAKQCMETLLGLGGSDDDETIRQQIALCDMASAYLDLCEAEPVAWTNQEALAVTAMRGADTPYEQPMWSDPSPQHNIALFTRPEPKP